MAAIYDIGCFVGCIVAFLGAEKFGRKGSLMWGTWIMVVGTILQAAAFEEIQMIISRIISGIGNGINTCAVWFTSRKQSLNRLTNWTRCLCGKRNAFRPTTEA